MLSFYGANYVESYEDQIRREEMESAARMIEAQEEVLRQQGRLEERRAGILAAVAEAKGGPGGVEGLRDTTAKDPKKSEDQDKKEKKKKPDADDSEDSDDSDEDADGSAKLFNVLPRFVSAVGKASGKIHEIQPGEVPEMLRYALLAENVYLHPEDREEAGDPRIGALNLSYLGDAPGVDEETAVYVDHSNREVVVSFRGTVNTKDLISDVKILFSRESSNERFQQAEQILREVKAMEGIEGYRVVTTGHSLGGRLALYAGMREGADFMYIFNPGLSPLTINNDCKSQADLCKNNLIIYTTGSDFISISAIFSKGLKIIRVPPPEKTFFQRMKEKIPGMGILSAHTMSNFTNFTFSTLQDAFSQAMISGDGISGDDSPV
jgi:hypothetical protein